MDGHESHKTPEMHRLALEHNIEFFFLPPHTTHRVQPLDVGVFGPLQRRWQEWCDEIISETNGEIPRSEFVKEYINIRNKIFTKELIQSAWKKAGMWPPNSRKFTEKDFAPSKLMSYAAYLPPDYPELPEEPDVLVIVQGRDGGDGVSDEVGRDSNGLMDEVMSNDGEADKEGVSDDDEDNEMDESGGEDDERGDGSRRETSSMLRYERKPYHLDQLLMHPYSLLPSTLLMLASDRNGDQIKYLEEEVRSLRSQLETALAHSTCAGWEIKSLQERLNSKDKRMKKRKVQVNAHYISSAEAVQMLVEQERADAEKRQKEEDAQAAKKAKDDQRKQQREAGNVTFFGSLNSKTRDDLLDISFALELTGSDSNVPEIKATLITMINAHLDNNTHLASNPTFTGLFLSRTRGRKRNTDENVAPTPLPPPVPPPLGLPHRSLPSNLADGAPEPESDPPMVFFGELPGAGRFFQSISLTPPDFGLPDPSSSFPRYSYPPLISHTADPYFPPPFHYPPPPASPYS